MIDSTQCVHCESGVNRLKRLVKFCVRINEQPLKRFSLCAIFLQNIHSGYSISCCVLILFYLCRPFSTTAHSFGCDFEIAMIVVHGFVCKVAHFCCCFGVCVASIYLCVRKENIEN